jgi:sulfate permease, SulP family
VVRKWTSKLFRRGAVKDLTAGLVHGLVSVPDGLAAGVLAGVNPVAGLYGYLFGTVAGALSTSSVFMSVQATGAMAALISDVPQVHSGPLATTALATLGVLTGITMLVLGIFKLGSLVRFVPNAVLVGFVNAVAINIALGQFSGLTGFTVEGNGGGRVVEAVVTAMNLPSWNWPSVAIAATTIILILILERTRLGTLSLFVAVAAGSGLTALLGLDGVELIQDVAEIPAGLPLPVLPSFAFVPVMLLPALSLTFVALVQGAAISQSVPNPDGRYPDISGDFRGQGIANIASGLLRGMPVGGSMSGTAVLTAAGAQSRLANLTAGAVMAISVLLFSGLVGYIATPSLAALLVLIGIRMFKPEQLLMVWRTGRTQAAVMLVTFILTIMIPLQYAVVTGVALSVVLFIAQQSNTINVMRWRLTAGSVLPKEEAPPTVLPPQEIVVLVVYGSLFFASAPVFEAQLPKVDAQSAGSVVVLRLRGKQDLGSTFVQALTRYKDQLDAVGGHLVLAGVGERVLAQLTATGALDTLGSDNVFAATADVGESLTRALERARALQN